MKNYAFWFITGSQDLYGEETLRQVRINSEKVVAALNAGGKLPGKVVFKDVVIDPESIRKLLEAASTDDECAGVITWMHTFSPAKMWIPGLKALNRPLLHINTQFNRHIPLSDIDMDYMNLHQAAHGDREFGYICARMGVKRTVLAGYFEDDSMQEDMAKWMRAAIGIAASKSVICARFGDNMNYVAVTDGDRVEAMIKLGWDIQYVPVGALVEELSKVTDSEADSAYDELKKKCRIDTDKIDSVKYQLKEEIALRNIFGAKNVCAFTTNFQDLYGLKQLPGLACQSLMADGFGFAGEGDWKTACLLAVAKRMEAGLSGGSAFMEDYTYDFTGNGLILGAHMLEVDPSIGQGEITVSVEPLGIGDREPPARMKFKGKAGSATCASLIDMGDRLRLIVADVEAVEASKAVGDMPNLPVAQIMWKPLPDLKTSAESWIKAGGAHHTVLSYTVDAKQWQMFAEMAGIEFIHIG